MLWVETEDLRRQVTKQLFEEGRIKNLSLLEPVTLDLLQDAITVAVETIQQGTKPLVYRFACLPNNVDFDAWLADAKPKLLAALAGKCDAEVTVPRQREVYITAPATAAN